MAAAGVIGTIGGHGADLFAFGDLVEQFRQHGAVTIAAGGEFHRPDVRRGCIHGQMDLAPSASALNAVLARLPFAIAEELDAGAVHAQVQRAIGATIRDLDGERLLPSAQGRVVRHGPIQVCQLQQAGHHPGRLPERQPEQDLDGPTELTAASENTAGRPGLPSGGASQVISLSSQISSDPRLRSATE